MHLHSLHNTHPAVWSPIVLYLLELSMKFWRFFSLVVISSEYCENFAKFRWQLYWRESTNYPVWSWVSVGASPASYPVPANEGFIKSTLTRMCWIFYLQESGLRQNGQWLGSILQHLTTKLVITSLQILIKSLNLLKILLWIKSWLKTGVEESTKNTKIM